MASFFRLFGKFAVLMISAIAGTCLQRLSGALQASPRFISERNRPKRSFSAEHLDRERRSDYSPIGLAESTLGVDLLNKV
jgi:hypothetical protein